MPLIPIVIERSGREERAMDIYSRLLQDRIILLGSAIDDQVANVVVAQMLVLAHQDSKADIHLYINSPGGSVTAGMAIYDTMQFVPCDVATYCMGQCASMGSLLLAAGAAGKRNALPHGRIMIHQPLAGMEGTATDILIHAEEFIRMKKQLNGIYRKHTGQTLERLQEDTDRDRFMGPEEAKEYGLIDNVVERDMTPNRRQPGCSDIRELSRGDRTKPRPTVLGIRSPGPSACRWFRSTPAEPPADRPDRPPSLGVERDEADHGGGHDQARSGEEGGRERRDRADAPGAG